MEISRRHLQENERAELRELLEGSLVNNPTAHSRFAELVHGDQELYAQVKETLILTKQLPRPDAAEMQRQVDSLTRNQRRVLNKRMRKAAKK